MIFIILSFVNFKKIIPLSIHFCGCMNFWDEIFLFDKNAPEVWHFSNVCFRMEAFMILGNLPMGQIVLPLMQPVKVVMVEPALLSILILLRNSEARMMRNIAGTSLWNSFKWTGNHLNKERPSNHLSRSTLISLRTRSSKIISWITVIQKMFCLKLQLLISAYYQIDLEKG